MIMRFNDAWIVPIIVRGSLLGVSLAHIQNDWDLKSSLFLVAAMICAVIINISLKIIIAASTFWIYDSSGLHHIFFATIYDLSYYPVSIYGAFIESLFTWFIPLAFVSIVPISYFISHIDMTLHLILLPLITLIFVTIAMIIWKRGVKRYESTGS